MNLILDTHSLIWFLNGDEQLTIKAKNAIEDPNNSAIISIASIWEIAIKLSLGKFNFPKGFKNFLVLVESNGFHPLPITFEHALVLSTLEFIHRDLFDRLLIAQCIANDLILITKDNNIKR
ncbi:type II toxin-antitoxin system VapC family toxin [Mariniphaga sediminis]|uniref:type II toxin-antitoxin system VapC family toxin n=1 Tax=Mariniphaga sediminis TaxID=1628158 RepID=UPI0035649F08